jgi:hypothetical protein
MRRGRSVVVVVVMCNSFLLNCYKIVSNHVSISRQFHQSPLLFPVFFILRKRLINHTHKTSEV